MKISLAGLAALLVLIGAGCTPAANTPTNTDDGTGAENNTATTENTGPVLFGSVGASIMDSKYYESTNPEGYMRYAFTDGSGTCVDEGLVNLSYQMDDALGYFAMVSDDGSYTEPWTSLDFTGQLAFSFPLTSGDANCLIDTSVGSDTATARCTRTDEDDEDAEPVEVCTATYTVMAHK